jgi:hypothetical protein
VERREASLARCAGVRAEVGEHGPCRLRDLARARRHLQELAHDTEAEVALQRAAASAELTQLAGAPAPGLVQDGRLADPGRALDKHRRAAPVLRRPDRALDGLELMLAFERDHDRFMVFRLGEPNRQLYV